MNFCALVDLCNSDLWCGSWLALWFVSFLDRALEVQIGFSVLLVYSDIRILVVKT
jgi:hypothetical protein